MNKFVVGDKVYDLTQSRWCTVTGVLKRITLECIRSYWEDELIPCGEGFYREKDWDEGTRVKVMEESFYYLLDGEPDRVCDAQPESYLSAEAPVEEVVHETDTHRWVRRGGCNYLEEVS